MRKRVLITGGAGFIAHHIILYILKNTDLYKKIEVAKINLKVGNVLEANKIFQELLKTNSDSFDLLYEYGLFCKNLKNYNLAKRVFITFETIHSASINIESSVTYNRSFHIHLF